MVGSCEHVNETFEFHKKRVFSWSNERLLISFSRTPRTPLSKFELSGTQELK
jgi:hypothetical protein